MYVSSVSGFQKYPVYGSIVGKNNSTSTVSRPESASNISVIAFRGGNKNQALFYGVEVRPYFAKGGVSTIFQDMRNLKISENAPSFNTEDAQKTKEYWNQTDKVFVSPVYNGKEVYDYDTGTIKQVKLDKIPDNLPENSPFAKYKGKYFMTNSPKYKEYTASEGFFAKENLNDCLVSIAPIRNYASECSKQFDLFLDVKEFSKKELEYIVDILKLGFKATIYPLPQIIQHCVATSEHAYMIGPDGNLFGCWTDAGKPGKEIGNIFELIKKEKEKDQSIDNSYYLKNILYTPLKDKECADCNILPLCMGTCVTLKTCPTLKYNLFDVLKFEYDRRKKKVIV